MKKRAGASKNMTKKHLKEDVGALAETTAVYSDRKESKHMTHAELIEEVDKLRALWSWIPENIKYLISNIGKEVVFTDRNNKYHYGAFHGFECDITQFVVFSASIRYDEVTHKPHIESGIDKLFASNVTNYKFLESRVEQESQT